MPLQLLFVCPKDCLPHEDPVKGFGLVTLEEAGDNHTFPLPAHNKKYGVIQGYTLDESVRGMSLGDPLAAALLDSSVTDKVRKSHRGLSTFGRSHVHPSSP